MENYLMIDGKKISLSEDTVKQIQKDIEKETEPKYMEFRSLKDKRCVVLFDEKLRTACQIGRGSVPENLQFKCLILSDRFNWKIIDNPNTDSYFTKLLVCIKK